MFVYIIHFFLTPRCALADFSPQVPYHPFRLTEFLASSLKIQELEEETLPSIELSSDIVPIILSYCDAESLSRTACVSREWHRLSLCNDLWENLCRETFGVSAFEIKPHPDPIKQLYILSHKHLKFLMTVRSSHPAVAFGGLRRNLHTSIPLSATLAHAVL